MHTLMTIYALRALPLAACAILLPTAAHAEIPEPVQAMIDQAMADKDDDAVATVIALAKKTNPDDSADLDAMLSAYQTVRLAEKESEAAQAEAQKYADNGLFDNWSGNGELGGFRSTGNTNNIGVTAGLKLTKESERWRHKLNALLDFQRVNGVTTKEQFIAGYEPNFIINDRLFAFGLAQVERDRFQGFSARYSVSGGLGYRLVDSDKLTIDAKAGPSWRRTDLINGTSNSSIAALAAVDMDWQLSKNIKFTEDAEAFWQSGNSTLRSTTGLEAALTGALSVRLSYTIEHETNPPIGSLSTDTLSRFTFVYGF